MLINTQICYHYGIYIGSASMMNLYPILKITRTISVLCNVDINNKCQRYDVMLYSMYFYATRRDELCSYYVEH